MKKIILFLLIFLCLVDISIAQSTLQARIIDYGNFTELLPDDENPKQNVRAKNLNIAFKVYIPGLGRARIKLNKKKGRKKLPTFSSGKIKPKGITLFQGRVISNTFENPLGASIVRKTRNGIPVLTVGFLGTNLVSEKKHFYRLKIPLTSGKLPKYARIERTRNLPGHSHGEAIDEPLTIPLTEEVNTSASSTENFTTSALDNSYILDLSLDAEKSWYDIYGENSNAEISTIVNEVEAIYIDQLGVSFNIVRQEVSESINYGSSNAGDKLVSFNDAIVKKSFWGSGDLYHLFTGQDLDGSTVGLAYLGVLCRATNALTGLTQDLYPAANAAILAHELGHNFGANHDSSNSSGLMFPSIGSPPAKTFSTFSVNEMETHIASYNSCLDIGEGGGGDDGRSGDPADEFDNIDLSVSLNKKGAFSATITLLEDKSDCTVSLRGSHSKKKIGNGGGSTLTSFVPTSLVTNLEVTNRRKTFDLNNQGKQKKVYLGATLSCPSVQTRSATRKLKTNKVKSSKGTVTAKKWVKLLKKKL